MPFTVEKRSLICAIAANAAYFKGSAVVASLNHDPLLCHFDDVTDYEDVATNSQAFIASNDDIVLVAFRGTEVEWKDVLTDARTRLVTDQNGPGLVHTGFQIALHSLMQGDAALLAGIQAAMMRGKAKRQLWLTGHSLGGALATLAAQFCEQNQLSVHALCTFGAPMVGDSAFAANFNQNFSARYQRYVHHDDLIPRLPSSQYYLLSVGSVVMRTPIGTYRQVGLEYYIDQQAKIAILPVSEFEPATKTALPIPIDSLADHHMAAYIDAIRSYRMELAPSVSIWQHQPATQPLTRFGTEANDLNLSLLPNKPVHKCCCVVS